jgi:exosome complex RNA-binding protein Csl4
MKSMLRGTYRLALAVAMLAATGCAQLGQLGSLEDVLGTVMGPGGAGQQGGELRGEIRHVDTRNQRIEVDSYEGQRGTVHFDSRTRVVYQQREYPVTALEQGDVVGMRVQRDSRGNLYTDYIQVQESVRDRGGDRETGGRTQQIDGNVGAVNQQRGEFELRTRQHGTVRVFLTYGADRSDVDRFRRLRSGDYVRAEVTFVSQGRAELVRLY